MSSSSDALKPTNDFAVSMEDLLETIKCPIDLEPYEKAVSLVPCSHKLCEKCAILMFGEMNGDSCSNKKPCSLCRKIVTAYYPDHAFREFVQKLLHLPKPPIVDTSSKALDVRQSRILDLFSTISSTSSNSGSTVNLGVSNLNTLSSPTTTTTSRSISSNSSSGQFTTANASTMPASEISRSYLISSSSSSSLGVRNEKESLETVGIYDETLQSRSLKPSEQLMVQFYQKHHLNLPPTFLHYCSPTQKCAHSAQATLSSSSSSSFSSTPSISGVASEIRNKNGQSKPTKKSFSIREYIPAASQSSSSGRSQMADCCAASPSQQAQPAAEANKCIMCQKEAHEKGQVKVGNIIAFFCNAQHKKEFIAYYNVKHKAMQKPAAPAEAKKDKPLIIPKTFNTTLSKEDTPTVSMSKLVIKEDHLADKVTPKKSNSWGVIGMVVQFIVSLFSRQ